MEQQQQLQQQQQQLYYNTTPLSQNEIPTFTQYPTPFLEQQLYYNTTPLSQNEIPTFTQYPTPFLEQQQQQQQYQQQQSHENHEEFENIATKCEQNVLKSPQKIQLSNESDNTTNQVSPIKKKVFMIFVVIAIILNSFLMSIWLVSDHGFPWFLYPLSISCFILATFYIFFFHHNENINKKFLELHFSSMIILNITIFLTYLFAFSPEPWFIYVLAPSLSIFLIHHALLQDDESSVDSKTIQQIYEGLPLRKRLWQRLYKPLFHIHLAIFVPLNVMLFICWTASNPTSAWFIYPLIITGCLVGIHYFIAFKDCGMIRNAEWISEEEQMEKKRLRKEKWFLAHLTLFSSMNFLLFIAWYEAGHGFPWFIFPLVLWIGVLIFHLWITFPFLGKKSKELLKNHDNIVPVEHYNSVNLV